MREFERIIRRSADPRKRLLASDDAWRNGEMQPRDRPPGHLPFPFRYRDPLTGKWVRARYKAERHVIAASYAEWELIGTPEIRLAIGAQFTPW